MTDIETIEWLKQIRDKYIHGGDVWFDEQRCRAIEYAIECIYKRSKWIPVTERLPEVGQQVLCFDKHGVIFIGSYMGAEYKKGVSCFRDTARVYGRGTTHWMLLP